MKKRFMALCLCFCTFCMLCACSNNEGSSVDINGDLADIMAKVYDGISEDQLPMGLENQPITKENIAIYIGTDEIDFKEALASESMIGSTAHSVVLIRMNPSATPEQIEDAKDKIKSSADPRKWICVEAEHVYVENHDDLIILIMSNELAGTLKSNFEKLK